MRRTLRLCQPVIDASLPSAAAPAALPLRGGENRYIVDAVTRACRRGRAGDVAAAATRLLAASRVLDTRSLVFALNRLAHEGSHSDARFWEAAAEALERRVPELEGELLGIAANAFSRAGASVPGLLRAISARVLEDLDSVPVGSVTLLLNAVGPDGDLHHRVVEHLAGRLPDMNSQDAAQFLSSLGAAAATGPAGRPGEAEVLGALEARHGLAGLERLPPPAVAQLVQAFARLMVKDEKLMEGLKSFIVDQRHRFPPQSASMVVNAYARLTLLDHHLLSSITAVVTDGLVAENERQDCILACGANLLASKQDVTHSYDHVAVTQLLNAHAKIRVFDRAFFHAAMDWMTPQHLSECSPQSIAIALHAFAKFPSLHKGREALMRLRALFATCIPEITRRARDFTVQNLVNSIQAFSLVRVREQAILAVAEQQLLPRRASWKTQDMANLASSLARLECFSEDVFSSLASTAAGKCRSFRSDELATLLNALAHYVRQPGDGPERRQQALTRAAAVTPAFEAAAQRLDPGHLVGSTDFEVALMLNSFTKVRPWDTLALDRLLAELDGRAARKPVTLVGVGLVLGALARIRRQPPPHFRHASLALVAGDTLAVQSGLDAIRAAGLLNALVCLDAGSDAAGLGLGRCLGPLLRHLLAVLESPGRAAPQGAGSEQRFRGSGAWDARTLPTALDAVCMASCGCRRRACAVCGPLWWRSADRLLRAACSLERWAPKGGAGCDAVVERQLGQALLCLFHLRLRPSWSAQQPAHLPVPTMRLMRACRSLAAKVSLFSLDPSSTAEEVADGVGNGRSAAINGEGSVEDAREETANIALEVQGSTKLLSSSRVNVLDLYSIDLLISPLQI